MSALDLDELERITLALIARVRELEGALAQTCLCIELTVQSESQFANFADDPDMKLASSCRAILAKGATP